MKNDTRTSLFARTQTPRWILTIGALLAIGYLYIIAFWFPPSNLYLFAALMLGQVFLIWQILTYIHTVWNTEKTFPRDDTYTPEVDVFITVAGEPTDVVEATARAAQQMNYPRFRVYLLNDGYVAGKDNWQEIEDLAQRLGVQCITRTVPGGAKAGNINHALRMTPGRLVAIFDADHVPHADFLAHTVGYFSDSLVGFVQTPQYYKNKEANYIAQSAWEQQELFFGPICKGKNNYNAATMCGTNMVIRREAIMQVGGMCEDSIAEDFVTGLFMHEKGWASIYVPEVLAEGLAPEDYLSYSKQQHRWARGALDVIFRYNLFFRRGLTGSQKIQYLSSVSHFLSGVIILMNALFPVIFLFSGEQPFQVSTMTLAAVFLPYMFITLYILIRSSNGSFTFNALAFSMGGFAIHITALFHAATGAKSSFSVTSKKALTGNFLNLVVPHIVYVGIVVLGIFVAVSRDGLSPAVANNIAWALISCAVFIPAIAAAAPKRKTAAVLEAVPVFDTPQDPGEPDATVFVSHSKMRVQSSA